MLRVWSGGVVKDKDVRAVSVLALIGRSVCAGDVTKRATSCLESSIRVRDA